MAATEMTPAYAPEDPTLPKPWTGLIDGNTGVLYYWNPETNATQYEKPVPLPPPIAIVPPSASTPKLAPIPTVRSQTPNNNTLPQHDLGRQMPQQQPMHQMPNLQAHHVPNQPNQQYPHMQVNQMAQSQFSKINALSVPHCQGQQQHGLPIGNHQLQQNRFPMERDLRRQVGEPVGFSAPPIEQTSGPSGDLRFTSPAPHIPRTADYSVRPEQHFGRSPPTGTGAAFSELQQMGLDGIHRQRPNQMGNPMSQPPMGQNAGYGEEQHGRGRNGFYSSSSKEGPMMFQNQQQHGSIPHAGNHQDIRIGAIPHPVTSCHSSGLNMGQEITMPRIHDRAVFPNMAPRGLSKKMSGSADFTNVPAADSYSKHHEITVMGDNVPAPFTTFESTGFAPEILREMRYLLQSRAYVVRCAAIPPSTQQLVCP